MRFVYLVGAMLALTPLASAQTRGTLTPPQLQRGQYVYAIPADFDPPSVGKQGMQDLQAELAKLHHPFYVVFAQTLPDLSAAQKDDARQSQYTATGDDLKVQYAIDRLMDDLATTQAGVYDTGRSSMFLLAFSPKKFALVPAARWKTEAGLFGASSLAQFDQHFKAAVKGSAKDPKGGIIRMTSALDEFVFDKTDPARVKARSEAERVRVAAEQEARRKAAESERVRLGRSSLDAQIIRLVKMLGRDASDLPTDVSSYKSLLSKAEGIRKMDDPATMTSFATEMKPSVDLLQGQIAEIDRAQFLAGFEVFLKVLFGLALIGAGVLWFVSRKRTYQAWQDTFTRYYEMWDSAIQNAATQYINTYARRDGIVAMTDVTGKTKELWAKATAEVDEIWIGVTALRGHVDQCKQEAVKGSFWNFKPFKSASDKINSAFEFDTGEINQAELFAPEKKTIRIDPISFKTDLTKRFRENKTIWDRLQTAADSRLKSAMELFPHDKLSGWLDLMDKHRIPQKWLSDHPLFGDDKSDTDVWNALDALRWADPISYMEAIEAHRTTELKVQERVEALVQGMEELAQQRVESIQKPDIMLAPMEDPAVTLAEAHEKDENVYQFLRGNAENKDVEAFQSGIKLALSHYKKVREQVESAEAAINTAGTVLKSAFQELTTAAEISRKAKPRLHEVAAIHSRVADVEAAVQAGTDMYGRASNGCREAQGLLDDKKYLEALRKAEKALSMAKDSTRLYQESLRHADSLDEQKRKFEQRQKEAGNKRKASAERVKYYGGSTSHLRQYQPVTYDGRADYSALLTSVVAQEHAWERAAREAEQVHAAEQARIRAEEARQEADRRRREQEEDDRQRRESYSSYSSSSSSWDSGSSFSGSSGDSGGGGFSGSSGDW